MIFKTCWWKNLGYIIEYLKLMYQSGSAKGKQMKEHDKEKIKNISKRRKKK